MQSTTRASLAQRMALSALLFATSIVLAGCAFLTPAAPPQETPTATPTTSTGYVYEDADAGYAVTFPGEPEVEAGLDGGDGSVLTIASYVTSSAEPIRYMAQGITEFEFGMVDLPIVLVNSAQASGAVVDDGDITAAEIHGLPAFIADVTMSDGTPGAVLMAGDVEAKSAYQLVVVGGTPEERQAFFDSFVLLD
jgi:hypothetical protein